MTMRTLAFLVLNFYTRYEVKIFCYVVLYEHYAIYNRSNGERLALEATYIIIMIIHENK